MCAHKIYSDALVRHYKQPLNKGRLSDESTYESGYNPKCGDAVHLSLKISDDGYIQNVMFEGQGCMICLASASILTEQVKTLSVDKAIELINRVDSIFTNNNAETLTDPLPDDMQAFSSIRKFPTRTQCVTLAWHTLLRALKK